MADSDTTVVVFPIDGEHGEFIHGARVPIVGYLRAIRSLLGVDDNLRVIDRIPLDDLAIYVNSDAPDRPFFRNQTVDPLIGGELYGPVVVGGAPNGHMPTSAPADAENLAKAAFKARFARNPKGRDDFIGALGACIGGDEGKGMNIPKAKWLLRQAGILGFNPDWKRVVRVATRAMDVPHKDANQHAGTLRHWIIRLSHQRG